MSASMVPITERYFEDYIPGSVFEYGSILVDEPEVIEFAKKFDPQGIHIDAEAAGRGPFGGLIASGWHTAGIMMRLLADNFVTKVASLGSPGVDELRWIKPVRPGDLLKIRVSVIESKRSRSKPDRGIVRTTIEVLNQKEEVVMSLNAMHLFQCRTPS
jgi:acyl dehydratase